MTYPAYKVAAMHVAPVFLDAEATVQKSCALIAEAVTNGARLVAFPEVHLPAFPLWAALRAPLYNHDFFCRLAASSPKAGGPEIQQICAAARHYGVMVSYGFNEATDVNVGCLWNSNVLIDETGRVINHQRKLVPTFWEKLVWANGDGTGLQVCDTALGRFGMLICGENTNPLARFALMAQGEQVHVSSFPPVWPAHDPKDAGAYDVADAIRIRVRNHAFEGKLFNMVAAAFMDQAMLDGLSVWRQERGADLAGQPPRCFACGRPHGLGHRQGIAERGRHPLRRYRSGAHRGAAPVAGRGRLLQPIRRVPAKRGPQAEQACMVRGRVAHVELTHTERKTQCQE